MGLDWILTRTRPEWRLRPTAAGRGRDSALPLQRLVLALLLLCFVLMAGGVGVVSAQESGVHVVQPGDTLWSIAARYGVTVGAIVSANGLPNGEFIYVGQRLAIPGATGSGSGAYIVRRGDTMSGIALRNGVSLWALLRANGLSGGHWIHPGQRLVIPGVANAQPQPSSGQTYVVRPGDTLSQIAQRLGTTAFELGRYNSIVNPSFIYVGQVLRFASGGSPSLPSGGPARILIDLSQQHLYAYEGERLVYSFICSSGAAPYYTRTGEFQVQSKIPNAYGSTWGIWMAHWLGIYWAGGTENGIHALPILPSGATLWAGYLGSPVSYGCIVLGSYEAYLLYQWAAIGTPVTIQP